jgi:hypothetical protein
MEKESNENETQIARERYDKEKSRMERLGRPVLTLTKEHILLFGKLVNQSMDIIKDTSDISLLIEKLSDTLSELCIMYKELYESNHFKFDDIIYFGMAVFTALNVEHIPENKHIADKIIQMYVNEKKEEEEQTKLYAELLRNEEDRLSNQRIEDKGKEEIE